MTTEKTFPKHWTSCPVCGSEESIVNQVRQDLIEKNKWNPALSAALVHPAVVVADPAKVGLMLTVPVVEAEIDICAGCGTLYARMADIKEARPQFQKPGGNGKGGGMGVSFNNPHSS